MYQSLHSHTLSTHAGLFTMKREILNGYLVLFCILVGKSDAVDEGWFWHVTDFHWDFSYWTDQLSCNGVNITNPGIYGNQWCDSPWKLVVDSVRGISDVKQNVDFILWTGDTVPHVGTDNLSVELNKELVRNVTIEMKNNFPNTKVYATFGNHDYYPTNMFPPHGNEIYNATYVIWEEWINETSQVDNFLKGGYYTVLVRPGIRLIALNTNMYYTKATAANTEPDPADQLQFLETTLAMAKSNNEKVMLTGHVPPGYTTPRKVRWMTKDLNQKFVEIIIDHSDVIVAMHFGHEHHDSFRLFYNSESQPVVSMFIAPSVTPWRYQIASGTEPPHNPGARLVKYDRDTGKQLDIIQYYVELDTINNDNLFQWVKGYTATTLYSISDITPSSMDQLIQRMTKPTSPEFQKFVLWYNTNVNTTAEYPCDMDCYRSVICGFRHLTEEPFNGCIEGAHDSGINATSRNIFNFFSLLIPLLIFTLYVYHQW